MWIRDPIDLLLFEHCVLRVRYSISLSLLESCEEKALELLKETHEFVVHWHARIEDKYVFPMYGEKAKAMSNDHLLIEKYGYSAINQRRKDWISRYVKIVLDHNLSEEETLFKDRVATGGDVMRSILDEMVKFSGYFNVTGLRVT
ncbi:cation-binding protein [Metallosphaera tengchongensis]|uniref:Cation-binding protein n=1 Tax=Metallosphaera tengchongensis TaxID=1532350 RepID=A0A6N0NWR5_9CREN|nr:hemerythrin domain-containing protein [Metallosphaera tengchongensis]QKR00667.1 cation-binding protein [Metallosphaera tengchongensis]